MNPEMNQESLKRELAEDTANFRRVIQVGINASNACANTPTDKFGMLADTLMLKAVLTSVSINQLLKPVSVEGITALSAPDSFSIAVLTRSLAENYLKFYAMICMNVSSQEKELRLLWSDWHKLRERVRAYENLRTANFIEGGPLLDFEPLHKDILSHPLFEKIPTDLKKDFLKKERPKRDTFESMRKIVKIAGISPIKFDLMYQQTSSVAHAEPLTTSFLQYCDPESSNQLSSVKLQINYATAFLAFTIYKFSEFFPKGKTALDQNFKATHDMWSDILAPTEEEIAMNL